MFSAGALKPGLAPAGELLFATRQKVTKKRAPLCRPGVAGLPSLRYPRPACFANSLRSNSKAGLPRPRPAPLGGAQGNGKASQSNGQSAARCVG
ncbi:protein of unknown function [Sterolibacterium denitrificans]|uniref:Uncharacterized protein n=1 Tax=Sterolibacterium denitrificans TaxID=157592 RepID=A0A7Z7MU69_9PROT|nr:protein of unknown function [Sterolibacterium denitrificans]